MGHQRISNNFRRFNKKKLIVAGLVVGFVLLIILIVVIAIIATVFNAVAGQADSGAGQSMTQAIATLWNAALDFIQALWKQVLANPLQFISGGNN